MPAESSPRLIIWIRPRDSGCGAATWNASLELPWPITSPWMRAPRATAASSGSSTTTVEPSEQTKPLRVASNGREAVSSDSPGRAVPRPFIVVKPASSSGCRQASTPPATTASAPPRRSSSAASPIACAPVAQAEHGA